MRCTLGEMTIWNQGAPLVLATLMPERESSPASVLTGEQEDRKENGEQVSQSTFALNSCHERGTPRGPIRKGREGSDDSPQQREPALIDLCCCQHHKPGGLAVSTIATLPIAWGQRCTYTPLPGYPAANQRTTDFLATKSPNLPNLPNLVAVPFAWRSRIPRSGQVASPLASVSHPIGIERPLSSRAPGVLQRRAREAMEKAGIADGATLAGHETLEDMLAQHLPPEKLKASVPILSSAHVGPT